MNHSLNLQIQTVGPEGGKILWVILAIALIGLVLLFIKLKIKIPLPDFSKKVLVSIEKNKVYHPTIIHFTIVNKGSKSIVIQNPVLRFRRGRKTKAYKITSVKTKDIYPLYLEPNKSHNLPVTLQPFYDHYKRLKRYSCLRVEFNYSDSRFKKSKYVLLKPTMFRKEK